LEGIVHGSSLGRWFEELCRIKHENLAKVVARNESRLTPRALPRLGGIYAFWWTGDRALLSTSQCNREVELPGPAKRPVRLLVDDEWLGLATDLPIPLYVGKNSSNISSRVGQHLLLGTATRVTPAGKRAKRLRGPTTSCQLRAGIEHLFPNEAQPRGTLLRQVGLSYVILDGDVNAANRFYLEDLAIGLMRPPFNLDIER